MPFETAGALTPSLVFGLRHTAGKRRGGHVSVARVTCVRGLANDELAQRHAGGGDLEQGGVGPGRARRSEQARASGVLSGALCIGTSVRTVLT